MAWNRQNNMTIKLINIHHRYQDGFKFLTTKI